MLFSFSSPYLLIHQESNQMCHFANVSHPISRFLSWKRIYCAKHSYRILTVNWSKKLVFHLPSLIFYSSSSSSSSSVEDFNVNEGDDYQLNRIDDGNSFVTQRNRRKRDLLILNRTRRDMSAFFCFFFFFPTRCQSSFSLLSSFARCVLSMSDESQHHICRH